MSTTSTTSSEAELLLASADMFDVRSDLISDVLQRLFEASETTTSTSSEAELRFQTRASAGNLDDLQAPVVPTTTTATSAACLQYRA